VLLDLFELPAEHALVFVSAGLFQPPPDVTRFQLHAFDLGDGIGFGIVDGTHAYSLGIFQEVRLFHFIPDSNNGNWEMFHEGNVQTRGIEAWNGRGAEKASCGGGCGELDDTGGDSNNGGGCGNVLENDCAGANDGVRADPQAGEHLGAQANKGALFYDNPTGQEDAGADVYGWADAALMVYDCRSIDDDAIGDVSIGAYNRAGGDDRVAPELDG
jgi:hypothetical protein